MKNNDISVIFNVYKRDYTLKKQIETVLNQSVNIDYDNIYIWANDPGKIPDGLNNKIKTFSCNWNTKFWGRFTIPLLLESEYIAIFDDDIYPNPKWFDNCLNTINKQEYNGILGGGGVIIEGNKYYPNYKIGWNGSHENVAKRVDLVGHAWFYRRKWNKYMYYEDPITFDNGEDIWFAYLAQKYGGINSFVPPHPENDKNFWSADPVNANKIGSDSNATWLTENHLETRNNICKYCVDNGWRTVNGR